MSVVFVQGMQGLKTLAPTLSRLRLVQTRNARVVLARCSRWAVAGPRAVGSTTYSRNAHTRRRKTSRVGSD
jgi:hypothetical protein